MSSQPLPARCERQREQLFSEPSLTVYGSVYLLVELRGAAMMPMSCVAHINPALIRGQRKGRANGDRRSRKSSTRGDHRGRSNAPPAQGELPVGNVDIMLPAPSGCLRKTG